MSDNEAFVTELLSAQIASLRAENTALRAAVERVRALHVGKQAFYPHPDGSVRALPSRICETCNTPFPCRAFRALEGTP